MMKKKDIEELKNKSIGQLTKIISDLEKEIMSAQIDQKKEKVKNVHQMRQKRKDTAIAMTILSQKQLAERISDDAK